MSASPIPVPVPDELSSEFWDAAADSKLVMQQCRNCGWYAYPPGRVCQNCTADPPDQGWVEVSGAARLKTWTIIRDSFLPGFADAVPFVVADIELPEQAGLRLVARLEGVAFDDLRIGLELEARFRDIGGAVVPYFVPAAP